MSLNILSVDVRYLPLAEWVRIAYYLPLAEWVRIALALMWRRRHGAVNSAMPSRIGIVNEGE